jgi:hypothetical protein
LELNGLKGTNAASGAGSRRGLGVSRSAARRMLALVLPRLDELDFTSFIFGFFISTLFENRFSRFFGVSASGRFSRHWNHTFQCVVLTQYHTHLYFLCQFPKNTAGCMARRRFTAVLLR